MGIGIGSVVIYNGYKKNGVNEQHHLLQKVKNIAPFKNIIILNDKGEFY